MPGASSRHRAFCVSSTGPTRLTTRPPGLPFSSGEHVRGNKPPLILFVITTILVATWGDQSFRDAVVSGLIFAAVAFVVYTVWDILVREFRRGWIEERPRRDVEA